MIDPPDAEGPARQPRGLAVLLELVRTIAGLRTCEALYPALTAAVRALMPADIVGLGVKRGEHLVNVWTDPPVDAASWRMNGYYRSELDRPGAARLVYEQLAAYPLHRELWDQLGVRSAIRVALHVEGRLVGILVSWVRDPRDHDRVDLRLVSELADLAAIALDRCLAHEHLSEVRDVAADQNARLRAELVSTADSDELIGRSAAFTAIREQIAVVAQTDATVLLTGESGTGKDVVARAIHAASLRRDRPMVTVNCAALPSQLAESELFGHEEGAFTGATRQRTGRFEAASGSTLFLDEVGELSLDVQAKLLRVLQERELERIGGGEPIPVDLRVIAATNRDPMAMIAQGKFREDLFYRLSVFPIHLPPLRARKDDIVPLVEHFIERTATRYRMPRRLCTAEGMRHLIDHDWPGNLRELGNAVERAMIISAGEVLDVESVVPRRLASLEPGENAEQLRARYREVLEASGWVIEGSAGAAARVGLHPNTFRYRMKRLGIERPRSG
jgi:formate hydrogenlyase transcriptional activator